MQLDNTLAKALAQYKPMTVIWQQKLILHVPGYQLQAVPITTT